MTGRLRTREMAIVCAVILGVLADLLIRVQGRPGINITLWALAGVACLVIISSRRDQPVATETKWLVGSAVMFAILIATRDAEALAVFCLFAAVVSLGLAAGRAALAWATRMHLVDLGTSAVRVGILIALGPLGWGIGAAREPAAAPRGRAWPQHARMLARGTVMAVPPLLVLTALLASADPVFERVLHNAMFDGLEPLLEHLLFAGVIAWLTSGYLRAFMVRDDAVMDRVQIPRAAVASAEISVALILLKALFLVFLIVQIRYLFGGASLVEVTEGLSYADYARRGFFELVAAAALVVPVLLVADWAAAPDGRGLSVQRATSALLVVLLIGGVLASAAYRMWLYTDAYGLTEDRLYGTVFMVWLTGVLVWLALTVLRGHRPRFAFGAVVGGLACIAALHALNPHGVIARVNIARAASGAQYDGKYLTTLSADAVPALVGRMSSLPQAERCRVAALLKERWSGPREGDWRTWNLGDVRARALVTDLGAAGESCGNVSQQVVGVLDADGKTQ